jgi:hypothetical protein
MSPTAAEIETPVWVMRIPCCYRQAVDLEREEMTVERREQLMTSRAKPGDFVHFLQATPNGFRYVHVPGDVMAQVRCIVHAHEMPPSTLVCILLMTDGPPSLSLSTEEEVAYEILHSDRLAWRTPADTASCCCLKVQLEALEERAMARWPADVSGQQRWYQVGWRSLPEPCAPWWQQRKMAYR